MESSRYTNIDIDKKIQKDVDFNDILKKVELGRIGEVILRLSSKSIPYPIHLYETIFDASISA
jgi:hypothetical protein